MTLSDTILEYFKQITLIPRESGNEQQIQDFLVNFAVERGLEYRKDAVGNVCIVKEASEGKEDIETLVLQAHQDMVCEKTSGSSHNFKTDPIRFYIEDGWMKAKETTLGADDGIGIASMLFLLDSDLPMGRIECVFTVSEETGMDGAFGMEKGFFTGRTMINLDSEDEGEMFIGCAGGLDTIITFNVSREEINDGYATIELTIGGGQGGHSGDDIDKGRLNAIKALAAFLKDEYANGLQIIAMEGGNKPNAIARECFAVIAVPDPVATAGRFNDFSRKLFSEYLATEPNLWSTADEAKASSKPLVSESAKRFIFSMADCPHGVIAMSKDIPDLVETSTNLASVTFSENSIKVVTSQRSSVPSSKKEIAAKVNDCFSSRGAMVEHVSEYPGWKPNLDSAILRTCVSSYERLFGVKPKVKAIHAGLECGLFEEKFGGLDMISFGPTLRGVHSPDERLEIASLDRFTAHLVDVVTNFRQKSTAMVKIAPSILSGNFLNLEPDLRMVNDNADLLHVDVMDGTFVPNISFGFPVVEAMAKVVTVPMDVHLMIINPDKYIERFAKVGARLISFHLEACEDAGKDPRELISMVKSCGAKAGIAIDPDVPVEKLFPYIEDVDFFLIMSVFAGFGGQKFIEESLDRIKTLKAEMDRIGVVKDIEVDGGVGKANAKALIDAGATMLVAGSSVFKAEDPAQAIDELRG